LYAFADSFAEEKDPFVEIDEPNENNNMATLTIVASTGIELAPSTLPDPSQLPPRWQPE
jgi:hypothetical protein